MIYLLDTNIFVETKKRFAPIHVGLSFWTMINRLAVSGSIASIDKVKDEINVLGDDLTVWSASQLPQGFYLSTSTAAVIGKYAAVINWANAGIFTQAAKDEFARSTTADAFLIAMAATDPQNVKIVTYETSEPARRNKVNKVKESVNTDALWHFNPHNDDDKVREKKLIEEIGIENYVFDA